MTLLTSVIKDQYHRYHLIVFQSSTAQSSLPILRHFLTETVKQNSPGPPRHHIIFSLLYPPQSLVEDAPSESVQVFDWQNRVPEYQDACPDVRNEIITAIKQAPARPLDVTIDSVGTLSSDIGTLVETHKFLHELQSIIRSRHDSSRLILHVLQQDELKNLLIETAFSPTIALITAHPPALVKHIATEYLMPPPPVTPAPKFWTVFLPISERQHDINRLVFGEGGDGGTNTSEIVLEILLRTSGTSGNKRAIERELEGWSVFRKVPCELIGLDCLKDSQFSRQVSHEVAPNPTQIASFNLALSPSQQESRSRVPLPYAHEGQPRENQSSPGEAAIFYDPDSADDIDDDDPDEDLNI